MGYKIALDDFGSGFTTFVNLYSPDCIKLGREFIEKTGNTKGDLIFRNIVFFAHGIGAKIICEGIENIDEDLIARESGCDYAQGYLYSRPMPPEESLKKMCQELK